MKKILFASFLLFNTVLFSQVAIISSPDSIICLGECVTISSATSITGSSPIINSIWSVFGPGSYSHNSSTAPGSNLNLCDLVNFGDYNVSLINQHQNGTSSFVQMANFITVQTNPIVDIDAIVNSCELPFSVFYNVGSSTSVPSSNYNWSFIGGSPSSFTGQIPPIITYSSAGTTDTRLIVTDPISGCKDTLVKPITVGSFDAGITSPNLACLNTGVQFEDASTIGVNEWSWSATGPGTVLISNPSVQNPIFTFSTIGTYTITLNAQNTAVGCAGSASSTINVVQSPFAKFSVSDTISCSPLSVVFTNETINTTGNSYSWNFGDGNTFTGQNPGTHIYNGTNGQTFVATLTVTDNNGCINTNISDTNIHIVNPQAHFSVSEKNGCEGINVAFTNQAILGGSQLVSQSWDFGDGTTFVGANPPSKSFLCGEYNVSLIVVDQQGCRDTTMLSDNFDTTFIYPNGLNGYTTLGTGLGISDALIKFGSHTSPTYTLDKNVDCLKQPFELTDVTSINCPHDLADVKREWFFNNSLVSTDSLFIKIFTDTLLNIGTNGLPGVDIDLVIDFRGCIDTTYTFDSIYVFAPKSSFTLVTLDPSCDVAQASLPIIKRVQINDLQSVYSHGWTNSTFFPTQNFPFPGYLIPNKTSDDIAVIYRWGDGTVETIEDIDAFLDDINKAGDIDPINASTAVLGSQTSPDPVEHTYDNYGEYTVEQVVINRNTGCRDSITQNINFSWVETDFVFDIPGPDSLCLNTPFTITTNSKTHGIPSVESNPHSPLTYSFNLVDASGNQITGNGSTQNQTFSNVNLTSGDYNVTLTTTNSVGCSNTFTNHLTVFALPIAVLTSQDQLTGCVGETFSATFENQSIHPVGSFGFGNDNSGWASTNPFRWFFSNGSPSTNVFTQNRSDQLTSVMNGPNIITLQVTDGFGCESSIVNLQTNVQQPSASFSMPTTICNSDVSNSLISAVGNFPSYIWILDGVQYPGANSSIPFPNSWEITGNTVSATHTVGLIISDAIGCTDEVFPQNITILNPQASFDFQVMTTSGNGQILSCPPAIANFTNTSSSSSVISSYSWQFGNIIQNPNMITSTLASPTGIQYLFPGTYDISLTIMDASGCTSTLEYDNFLQIGGPSATASVNQTGNLSFMEYSFNISNLSNVNSAYWELGNGETITNDSDGFIYTYQTSGTFNPVLHVVDAFGCDVAYQLGTIITGINTNEELSEKSKTTIYPNPTTDFLNLSLSINSSFEIFDLQGKLIETRLYSILDNKIDVSHLGAGMYLLKVISFERQEVMRFQKM
ncbi:MAG: PKD domain-containing protein [Bacteroidota bacterium]